MADTQHTTNPPEADSRAALVASLLGTPAPRGLTQIGEHIPFLLAMAALPSLPRWQLARIAGRAIECMDAMDPDTDAEPEPDDTGDGEDEHLSTYYTDGQPGCPVSDPGECAYTEWHTRGRHKTHNGGEVMADVPRTSEDDEDDDPDSCPAHEDNLAYGDFDGQPGDPSDAEPNGDDEHDWSGDEYYRNCPDEVFVGTRRQPVDVADR